MSRKLTKKVEKQIYEPLSNFDLDDYFSSIKNKKANIQMYDDIKKHQNINTLFKNYNYCIIFLNNPDKKKPVGHWVMVFYSKPNEVCFLDSYGYDIKFLCPKLIPILLNTFDKIHSNKVKYQVIGDRSATCGRHCLFSVGLLNLIEDYDFDDLKHVMDFLKSKNGLKNYNEVVSKFIDIDL